MNIYNIDQSNLDDKGSLIPPDVAENIGRLWVRGIVADDDNEEDQSGGIVWEYKNAGEEEKDTESEIIWAYGKNKEALDNLLVVYHSQIEDESAAASKFEMPEDGFVSLMEEAFSEDGFEIKDTESRDVYVTVGELAELKFTKKKPPFYIKSIKELGFRQFRNGIVDVMFYGKKGLLEDLAWVPFDWFEEDVSSCVVMDDVVKGFFLVHKSTTGVLVLQFLFSVDVEWKKTLLGLLRFSAREAIKKYPPETKILIRRHNDAVNALAEKLFPGKKGEAAKTGMRKEP